ncbi:MAG: 3,5-nucleoside bisphosphate phosphatase [Thermotogaceae bacterium]|nr:3,5-nucleoside bisphosphate phosphatase [Thermotogaceae bacterium]
MIIDFHTHTMASDGTLTPEQLVAEMRKKSITYFSITDHDTIDGVKAVKHIPQGLTFITGVEMSVEFPKTLHILGYGFDTQHEELNASLNQLQDFRKNRNTKMLEKMDKLGFKISMEELISEAGSDLVGRPHFANLMLRKGYVASYQEAFDLYLKKGAPLYLDKKRFEPDKAIELIHRAGGIAVMAHPYQTKLEGDSLENLVKELVSYGLDGIEVFYSQHTPEKVQQYKAFASKYELLATAGSDFHGANKPEIQLGMSVATEDLTGFLTFVKEKACDFS